ncbi:MAG: PhoH family protein [Mucilaginibacter polytrichastri]|nr:PhoH family protein [Mucilaginibacter polytrichastri]
MSDRNTRKKQVKRVKIFVLDTSVILYDHNAITQFQEHDVAIPIQVLEELDNLKSGNETRNFEARSFIRLMDSISRKKKLNTWISLNGASSGNFRVVMDNSSDGEDAESIFGSSKVDNRILNAAISLKKEYPEKHVILVSKDICLRLKAKSLDLEAEDYETGKVKNLNELYTGKTEVKKASTLSKLFLSQSAVPAGSAKIQAVPNNHFIRFGADVKEQAAFYYATRNTFERIDQDTVFGITPRNMEQAMALHVLMHPEIRLITLQGNAGTGKTLLAVASALEQRRNFRQIYVTRPIVPLSNKDIGFLPGDIKSKIDPYMAPIWDNLRFIQEQFSDDEKMVQKISEMVTNEKITIAPLAFIRGRTLSRIFFIVDEAQNLTPHEVKTIISRAGENTKIVFTGDIYQIDTPYLDAESNGLSYLIDKARNHPLYAHITLEKGERSELANLANELL